MPVKKLKDFLDSHGVRYVTIAHSTAYTAQEIAASAHISGKNVAKIVMVKVDGKITMVVLPASERVDLGRLKQALAAKKVELAAEQEFATMFPDCETGGMPPFGNIYGLDVVVAEPLTHDDEIAFNAGSHSELIKMAYKDFERLVGPKVCAFTTGV
ncbi:YbaK/EbsC family protein [Candidatus Sumerlaeota bacterium]|nr:YbaK/EbsC family protein [Candidatus Sumerlaeota bacterium]